MKNLSLLQAHTHTQLFTEKPLALVSNITKISLLFTYVILNYEVILLEILFLASNAAAICELKPWASLMHPINFSFSNQWFWEIEREKADWNGIYTCDLFSFPMSEHFWKSIWLKEQLISPAALTKDLFATEFPEKKILWTIMNRC